MCLCIAHRDDERSTDYISILFAYKQITGNCCEAPCQNALASYHRASAYLELLLKALKYLTCWVTLNLAYVNLRVRVALQNVCVPERVAVISRSASQHSFFVVVRLNCTFSKTGFFHYVARGKDLKRRRLLFSVEVNQTSGRRGFSLFDFIVRRKIPRRKPVWLVCQFPYFPPWARWDVDSCITTQSRPSLS